MPTRLIAVDLDGTLLNSRSEISVANRQALAAAFDLGVQIVIVTGRRFHSAQPFISQLPFPVTVISSNGARIGSPSGEAYERNLLPAAIARQVLETAHEYRPYAVAIFDQPTRGQVTMEENAVPEGPLGWYLRSVPDRLLQVPDLTAVLTSDPLQLMFGGPPDRVEPAESLLRASPAAPRVHLTWTKYYDRGVVILDVLNTGCSKGAALRRWAERCGIPPVEIMAIGDNYNDLEMLQLAGCPVVMENSTPGLARSDWLVTASHDRDGVARAIEDHLLNSRS